MARYTTKNQHQQIHLKSQTGNSFSLISSPHMHQNYDEMSWYGTAVVFVQTSRPIMMVIYSRQS